MVSLSSIWLNLQRARMRRRYGKALTMGNNLQFRRRFSIYMNHIDTARLTIGDDVFFNEDCSISCLESVTIGNHCLFGENVRIYDHDHKFGPDGITDGFTSAPVVIGDNCWIGTGCIILKGVTIGEGCVIAAGTTVTKSVPAHSLMRDRIDLVVTPL